MTLPLTEPVTSIGGKHEVVTVEKERALDLLSARKALILTPSVRKRFSELIAERHLSTSQQ
ncbi:MAG: hypothetical protein IT428_26180 [Planctomycetaceae bacterium]|nr:hypothetical protein [Planctomycetaceae bacterium]